IAPKCILGVVMAALLVLGTWAPTTARLSTATKGKTTTATKPVATSIMQGAPGCDNVFEGDGNAFTNDDSNAATEDWNTVVGDGTGTVPKAGSTAAAASFVSDIGADDQIFTGGSTKDFTDINQWRHTTGAVPDKDEITHAYAALY